VAAVGDGDPQVGDGAAEFVGQAFHSARNRLCFRCGGKEKATPGEELAAGRTFPFQAREAKAFPPSPSSPRFSEENRLRDHGYADRSRRSETMEELYRLGRDFTYSVLGTRYY